MDKEIFLKKCRDFFYSDNRNAKKAKAIMKQHQVDIEAVVNEFTRIYAKEPKVRWRFLGGNALTGQECRISEDLQPRNSHLIEIVDGMFEVDPKYKNNKPIDLGSDRKTGKLAENILVFLSQE